MAIRHWSGKRLAGTWIAGAVAECVLIALPVVFVFVVAIRDSRAIVASRGEQDLAVAMERLELRAPVAEAELSKLEGLRAIDAAESRVEMRAAPVPSRVSGLDMELRPMPWYGLPLVGAVAFYLLAIPVGLVGITVLWLISRLDRSSPPPSSA